MRRCAFAASSRTGGFATAGTGIMTAPYTALPVGLNIRLSAAGGEARWQRRVLAAGQDTEGLEGR